MESAPTSCFSRLLDEQKVIVKFFSYSRKKSIKIHRRLAEVYGKNVVPLATVEDWLHEFEELHIRKHVELPKDGRSNRKKYTENSVLLHKADEPWRPVTVPNVDDDQLSEELVLKKLFRILNKITDENFTVLLRQVESFPINTENCLRNIVKVLISYVCTEHEYSHQYAKLCAHLYSKHVPYEQQIIGACPMYLTFGELIREGCEEQLKMLLKKAETEEHDTSFQLRYNLKGINIFIGEMYMLNALPIEIIDDEYLQLLFDDPQQNIFKIECCYICLTKLGKFLELQCNKVPPKFSKEKLDSLFTKLSTFPKSESIKLPSFLRFLIMDLIELRSRNWIPRIKENKLVKLNYRKFNRNSSPKNSKKEYKRYYKSKARNSSSTLPHFLLKRESSEESKMMWKVRSCMNKMTDSNFPALFEQIFSLSLETCLPKIVSLICNKAVKEPLFSHIYAELCRQLSRRKFNNENNQQQENEDVKNVFKELLLNECNKIWNEKVINVVTVEGELWYVHKVMSKGIVKFFSELYTLGLLSSDIICNFIETLFNESKQTLLHIEVLCNFLTFIGEHFEADNKEHLENYFSNVKQLYEKTPRLSNRIYFMLLDVLELRERKWLPRVPIKIIDDGKDNENNLIQRRRNRTIWNNNFIHRSCKKLEA